MQRSFQRGEVRLGSFGRGGARRRGGGGSRRSGKRGMRARAGRPEGEEAAGNARKAPEARESARRPRAELSGKGRADARKQKIVMFRSGLDSTGGRQRRSCRRTLPDACPAGFLCQTSSDARWELCRNS